MPVHATRHTHQQDQHLEQAAPKGGKRNLKGIYSKFLKSQPSINGLRASLPLARSQQPPNESRRNSTTHPVRSMSSFFGKPTPKGWSEVEVRPSYSNPRKLKKVLEEDLKFKQGEYRVQVSRAAHKITKHHDLLLIKVANLTLHCLLPEIS